MSLSARAIALQGIGFGALFIALQGLVPLSDAPAPAPAPIVTPSEGGGGRAKRPPWAQRTENRQLDVAAEKLLADDEAALFAVVAFVLGNST